MLDRPTKRTQKLDLGLEAVSDVDVTFKVLMTSFLYTFDKLTQSMMNETGKQFMLFFKTNHELKFPGKMNTTLVCMFMLLIT